MTRLVTAANAFSFALARAMESEGNFFYSPVSLFSALLMVYPGAAGETAGEFENTLGLPDGLEEETLDSQVKQLLAGLRQETPAEYEDSWDGERIQTVAPSEIRLVQALWGQSGHPFRDAFLMRLERVFASSVHLVDFERDPEAARLQINDQIARDTRQRLIDLLPPRSIDSETRLVLTSAIHFKNSWADPFDTEATRDATFHGESGSSFEVSMMRKTTYLEYTEMDGLRLLRLPYTSARQAMLLALPARGQRLADLESTLGTALYTRARGRLAVQQVALELPRFRLETTCEMTTVLKELGIRRAFDPREADFGNIDGKEGQLALGQVLHATQMSVDEAGTEAAAATAVVMMAGSAIGEEGEPLSFRCNEPFLVFIVDEATGLILFRGRVTDPRS